MKLKKSVTSVMLLAALTLSGCSSYNSVRLDPQKIGSEYTYYKMEPPLYVGDNVKYKLKDGSEGELTVAKIAPTTLTGDSGKTVSLADISRLERKDVSKGKTAALVGGGVATTMIVVVAVVTVGIFAAIAAA